MPSILGGQEAYIYYDGVNGPCTYCTDTDHAQQFPSLSAAILGSNGLVDLWAPHEIEKWYLQSTIPIGNVSPAYLMVFTVGGTIAHTHTGTVKEAKVFSSEQEALAYLDKKVVGGGWVALKLTDRS